MVDKQRAEKAAQRLLAFADVDTLPIPVEAIAHAAGCVVKYAVLDDDLSGMALHKDGIRAIIVNAAHHKNRQRFTIAHELGHHQLHFDLLEQGVHVDKAIFRRDQYSAAGVNKFEIEANHFAAELLMPKKQIRKIVSPSIDLQDDDQIGPLASKFGVSNSALSFRILNVFRT